MTRREFQKAHNFRETEKCCASCKHGEVGYEGECGCFHPLIDADERMWSGNMVNDVCDLWEAEEGGAMSTETITPGNVAKLQEVLLLVSRVAVEMTRGTTTGEAPTRKEVDDWAMRLCDIIEAAIAAPPRECDRFADDKQADALHAAFIEHCNSCDCPMGCDLRKNPRFLLDGNCASIMKCFARFALSQATPKEGGAK